MSAKQRYLQLWQRTVNDPEKSKDDDGIFRGMEQNSCR
jgi:hypothetical protein